jgi:hypothetical protein
MAEDIEYPVADMISSAQELRSFLNEQLSQHNQLYINQTEAYEPLTRALAFHIPQAGGQALTLVDVMANKHKSIVKCYQELLDILDIQQTGAILMDDADKDLSTNFKNDA